MALEPERSPWLIVRAQGPHSYRCEELDPASNVKEARRRFFADPLRKSPASRHLDFSFVKPARLTQTSDLLTVTQFISVATESVVICYGNKKKSNTNCVIKCTATYRT